MVTVNLAVVDCDEYGISLSNYSICAYGDIRFNIKGACQGDSGGGLVSINSTLIGVLSAGFLCGDYNEPAVYCNVFLHKKWIEDTLSFMELQSTKGRSRMLGGDIYLILLGFLFWILA